MSDMKQKTKVGMVWNTIEKIAVQGCGFVISIVLANLLDPSDYGVVGMLNIFIAFSGVFIDSGFSRALIQKQDRTELDYSTTLIFNFLTSVVIYGILFFCAPAISRFYKMPELVSVQRVLFLTFIFNSLTVVQTAQLSVKVDFRTIAVINSLTTILGGATGIFFAYRGFAYWSLVIQNLAKSIISVILFWILGKWKPKTGFSFASFKKLFSFGSKLLASGLLATGVNNLNSLLIGRVYSSDNLGYYTKAQQFPELTTGTLSSVLNGSTFPLMSSLQDKKDELISVFKKLIRSAALVTYPAVIGLTVLSRTIIVTLIGEKWLPAVPLMIFLSMSYFFYPFNALNLNLLNAIGRSDLYLKVDASKIPFILATTLITYRISTLAMAMGQAVAAILYFVINAYMAGRLFKFGPVRQFLCTWKCFVSSLVMGALVIIVDRCIVSNLWSLILGILTGVISYSVMILLLRDDVALSFLNKVLNKLKRKVQ